MPAPAHSNPEIERQRGRSTPQRKVRALLREYSPQVDSPVHSEVGSLAGVRVAFLYNHDALHQVAHIAPLVAGSKIRNRLLAEDLVAEDGFALVGYPKFDALAARPRDVAPLFPNERPTVLYNPHFEPRLSSWYDMGLPVLDFFAAHPEYDLVVAPHVMLFRRCLHTSLENLEIRLRRSLPQRYLRFRALTSGQIQAPGSARIFQRPASIRRAASAIASARS